MLVRKIHFRRSSAGLIGYDLDCSGAGPDHPAGPGAVQRGGDRAERAAAAAGRDNSAAPGAGADHVVAPRPLDVEWRELGVGAWPVRRPAGADSGLEPRPLGAAADRRLSVGGRRLAGVTEPTMPRMRLAMLLAPALVGLSACASYDATARDPGDRAIAAARPAGGDGTRAATAAAFRTGAASAAGGRGRWSGSRGTGCSPARRGATGPGSRANTSRRQWGKPPGCRDAGCSSRPAAGPGWRATGPELSLPCPRRSPVARSASVVRA